MAGTVIVLDDECWVRFEASQTEKSDERLQGLRYSLTLHARSGKRLLGFDNAHAVTYGGKKGAVKKKKQYDHWHRDASDKGRPYKFISAGKLLEDFWSAVDKKLEEQ